MKLKNCIKAAIFSTFFLSILLYTGFFSNIQQKLSDNLYGGKTPLDSIIIAAIDDKSIQEIGRWPWSREIIAQAINQLKEAKVIGIDIAFFEPTKNDKKLEEAAKNANIVVPIEFTTFSKENNKIIGRRVLKPIKELKKAKKGYVNIITDKDGITRAVNMDLSKEYENFANAVYKEYWKKENTNKPQRFLVNFVGEPGSYKTYSITDIIHKRIPSTEFKNKLVLIGATSPDLHDTYFVPTSKGKAMPGVEIHANTIQTLINKDYLKTQTKTSTAILMLIFSAILALVFYKFKIPGAIITGTTMITGYLLAAIYIFEYGIIMNLIYVPLAILFTFISETTYSYITEKKAKTQIKTAFSKYVSPAVMNEIIKNPEKLKLGGTRKEITVFFSDIRGFTAISEKIKPEKLVHILNEYFTAMTNIITKHKGVVDKYIGDAIMAFWGAPLKQPKHAEMACNTSLDMIKKLKELQKKWQKEKFPEIKIGIGINTGHAVIGNMGSYERFDYTAIGDAINLGARLEGLTKKYGTNIIISENTKKKISKKFITRKLDLVKVKGKKKPVKIYELICRKEDLTKNKKEEIKNYEKGLEHYLNKKWDEAIKEFKKTNDFASKEFIKRCEEFKKNPPSKEWNGAWEMKNK